MDHALRLPALQAIEKEYPELSSHLADVKFTALVMTGRNDEAAALGRKLIEKAVKFNDPMKLNELAWLIVDPEGRVKSRDLDFAFEAATKAVELSKGEDGAILDTLARVHYWKGELDKAIEIQEKAVEKAASDVDMLAQLEDVLREYRAEAEKKRAG
jgi:tetratricopeptide (TPR) repeat protein